MTKTKWPPGPWQARPDGPVRSAVTNKLDPADWGIIIWLPDGFALGRVGAAVCTADRPPEVCAAIAALLAAAPKLYDALFYLADRFDQVDNGYCTLCGSHRLYTSASDRKGRFGTKRPGKCENPTCKSHEIRAALAEARGEFSR